MEFGLIRNSSLSMQIGFRRMHLRTTSHAGFGLDNKNGAAVSLAYRRYFGPQPLTGWYFSPFAKVIQGMREFDYGLTELKGGVRTLALTSGARIGYQAKIANRLLLDLGLGFEFGYETIDATFGEGPVIDRVTNFDHFGLAIWANGQPSSRMLTIAPNASICIGWIFNAN